MSTAACKRLFSQCCVVTDGAVGSYRGVWYEFEADGSFRSPNSVKHVLEKSGIGTVKAAAEELFGAVGGYSPAVQQIYRNKTDPRTEAVLLEFGTLSPHSYTLTNGLTLAEDMVQRPKKGAQGAQALAHGWAALASAVSSMEGGPAYYNTTAISLQAYAQEAAQQATKIAVAVGKM